MKRLTEDLRRESLEWSLDGLALDVLWLEDTMTGDAQNQRACLAGALHTVTKGVLRCADLLMDGRHDPACAQRAVVLAKYTRRLAKAIRATLRAERKARRA